VEIAADFLCEGLSFMVLPNCGAKAAQILVVFGVSYSFVAPAVLAQGYAPIPGAPAPAYGNAAAPPGHATSATSATTSYDRLPLNPGTAGARLEELRNLMPTTRAKDFQDAIGQYCDWLSDMADAHWKLAQAFGKESTTRGYADSERQLCLKFGQLKRQAMLLKAEFLISQRRYPEALAPLVDIVSAEPKTETGARAYKLLQEIGFADATAVASPPAATAEPAKSAAAPH
jgi:hypothetical protein